MEVVAGVAAEITVEVAAEGCAAAGQAAEVQMQQVFEVL